MGFRSHTYRPYPMHFSFDKLIEIVIATLFFQLPFHFDIIIICIDFTSPEYMRRVYSSDKKKIFFFVFSSGITVPLSLLSSNSMSINGMCFFAPFSISHITVLFYAWAEHDLHLSQTHTHSYTFMFQEVKLRRSTMTTRKINFCKKKIEKEQSRRRRRG